MGSTRGQIESARYVKSRRAFADVGGPLGLLALVCKRLLLTRRSRALANANGRSLSVPRVRSLDPSSRRPLELTKPPTGQQNQQQENYGQLGELTYARILANGGVLINGAGC